MNWLSGLFMVAAITGVTVSSYQAYEHGLRGRDMGSWFTTLGLGALLFSETGAVLLTFAWDVWNLEQSLWFVRIAVALTGFVVLLAAPPLCHDSGMGEHKKLTEDRNRQAENQARRNRAGG